MVAIAAPVVTPALAEHRKVVNGLEINIGIVPAAQLLRTDAYERLSHREPATNATHHVVVGVADAKTGEPVAGARVSLEIVDPRGATQSRTLVAGDAGGRADYSGLFRFGWSGAYKLRVNVDRSGAAPVRATFEWTQDGY
jgi:hypothetical protein